MYLTRVLLTTLWALILSQRKEQGTHGMHTPLELTHDHGVVDASRVVDVQLGDVGNMHSTAHGIKSNHRLISLELLIKEAFQFSWHDFEHPVLIAPSGQSRVCLRDHHTPRAALVTQDLPEPTLTLRLGQWVCPRNGCRVYLNNGSFKISDNDEGPLASSAGLGTMPSASQAYFFHTIGNGLFFGKFLDASKALAEKRYEGMGDFSGKP